MADDRSLKQQMDLFLAVNEQSIRRAGEAILEGGWEVFDNLVKSVSEARLTASIRDTLSSSSESRTSFQNIVGDLFGDEFAARAFLGALAAATGAILTIEAAAIAGAIGLTALVGATTGTITVVIVGVALIVWGLAELLPRVFEAASDAILQRLSQQF